MNTRNSFVSVFLILFVVSGFTLIRSYEIPKTWDLEKLNSMHLPLPDTSVDVNPISEEYYYQVPERVAYKSYPFYMPGSEPKGYYEWLKDQEPVVIFDAAAVKIDADWIKAGEVIYDMPQVYQVIDSSFLLSLPTFKKHLQKFRLPTTREGIIPFISIVVRKKGRIELGTEACGMCHSKIMTNGELLKGGQGNFEFPRFLGALIKTRREVFKVPDSVNNARIKTVARALFEAPWIKHESQERLKKQTIDNWFENVSSSHGLAHRQGTALGYPVSIPDLFYLKERKYFDHTGGLLQRDIGDLMRYGALNQSMDVLTDYNGFTPAERPAQGKGNLTRFSDAQLFALAKYMYSFTPPKNPNVYPQNLLAKGKTVFIKQGCVTCHTPPFYSNNKLTPVDGFEPPKDHVKKYDIFDISVGTDPVLALFTRRGTGYYKVPSLIGAWNRTAFLHGGNLAHLEDLFDPKRLEPDYVPTGYKPNWVEKMAVPGHSFGMELNTEEKKALVAFLKSL